MAATRKGMDGLPPRAVGCGGLREADICGGKRPQPGWADPPEGAAPARRFPCGAGHSPPRKAAGPAPHGNGLRAYSQNSKPIGRPDGEGVPVPAATRGTAAKSRRDALSANTATAPRGERLQTHLPRLLGQARRPRGGRAARWFPLEGDRRPHRNGAGSAGGIRWNQAPPPVRGAAQRSVCGSRALPVSAVRAGSVLWPKEAACPAGDPRRPRGERHPARLPGKGTAATCRTASGFRPRPLP